MTINQTHKALYVVALFSFLSLLCSLTILREMFAFARLSSHLSVLFILYVLFRLALVIMPFIKQNKILFLVPIDAYFWLPSHMSLVYDYFFVSPYILGQIGILPPILSPLFVTLMDVSGIIILLLRLVGYWQERKIGMGVEF
jgi:hypothetical protein